MSDSAPNSATLPFDRSQLLLKYFAPRDDGVDFPEADLESSIPRRFEKIARLYPNRIAVKFGEQSLTYEEFDKAANRIAGKILEQRGRRSEPIALLLEHGVDVLVAIFGVLKAGKFYIALDPTAPQARIDYMLNDAGAKFLLTNGPNCELAYRLKRRDLTALNIDEIEKTASWDESRLSILPDDFAALMYTSGSEGLPKGLVESHRFMLHSARGITHLKRITPRDRLTLFHFVGFAAAEAHLFSSLLNGACLCPFDIKSQGIQPLISWLESEGISLCHMPVSAYRHLAELIPSGAQFPQLRLMQLSGAPITRSDFDLFREKLSPAISLQVLMGTTEAGAVATGILDHDFSFPEIGTPIGYAWPDKQLQLVDESGCEVAPGQIGEMSVRSRYMSAGYWRDKNITRGKFLADDSGGQQRTYRTGDLARMMPDGLLIHMGRKDLRVKIRGYRVDISEVEQALLENPRVKEAAVAAWEREPDEKYLVGYIVPGSESALNVSDLNAYLRDRLPDYMIPSAFVFLESLPLTNGKLDRTALPKPEGKRPELSQSHVAPRDAVEQELTFMWEEVLDVCPIGIHDNFFDLGGHSLAATRILTRVLKTFQVCLRLTDLFQSPTIAGLAGQIAGQPRTINIDANFGPISQHRRVESCPLSFTQQRLWFLHQMEPESCAYNLLFATRLTGSLDVTALKQSLEKVVERHQVLRTTFINDNGNAQQVIRPSGDVELEVVDLCQSSNGASPETQVSVLVAEFGQIPFDLAKGPLLRVKLLRLGEDQFVLLHAVHHIIYDAWSAGIFARELSSFYNAIVKGETPAIQPLSIQYSDFAIWQHERFQQSGRQGDLEYWKRQLADLTTLELPMDRPRPPIQTHHGGKKSFILNQALTAALKKLGRNENATLFMILLAAFQTLLHRYTSQDDIVVGTAVDGRPQREIEDVIGFFLSTLVLRTHFSGDPSFRQLLGRVREVCLEAFDHRDLPFDKLVEVLQPERDLNRNPLFSVAFVLQNTPASTCQWSDVTAQSWELESSIAQFDLHIFMEEEGQTLKGTAIFNSDLFDAETISRLLGHFNVLLEGIVTDPEQRVSELPLLTEVERCQLLEEWNDTQREYPKDKCLHQVFEAQVETTPDAIAVVFGDQLLSYRELNHKANQLGRYLQKHGVGPEVLVGICMERSIEMIVALLAVLKAGGAYVPLDPSYPKERLKFMQEDTGCGIVLTDTESQNSLPATCARMICLDRDWEEIATQVQDDLDHHGTAEDLAYVIYTSGSTGEPKGVAVSHRAVNRLVIHTDYVQVTPVDAVAQVSNVSFDAATFEVWGALLNGARLVVIAKDTLLSPQSFWLELKRNGVTTLFLTTALFGQMVRDIPLALGGLTHLLFGGEAADPQRVKELLDKAPPKRLIHVYGPTETTTFASWYRVSAVEIGATRIPIGRAISNTTIYILDKYQNAVPIGVAGELCIGGAGVARGYLHRPELTVEKFIKNPFSSDSISRLYKTGDLARYLPNGNIEYLGRIDNQVKIRGFRIEPGEVEAVLAQHPAVHEAAVIAREDSPGDRRLAAYLVSSAQANLSVSELRSFVQQKLPEYMVPSVFVFLEALPLTPNGKLDRKTLPAPDQSRPEPDETFTAPRTPVEEILGNIWAEVLKLDKVGIHDNFFDLGGHSLLAAQVISRIRDAFRFDLPLRRLFEAPTIAGLAEQFASARDKEACKRALPILPKLADQEYPLSFSQERFWFLEQLEPNNPAYKIVVGFHLTGPVDVAALEKSFTEILRRHETLRTTFRESSGVPVQVVSEQWSFNLNVIAGKQEPGADLDTTVRRLLSNEYRRPFDLSSDLLLRGTLLRLGASEHVLFIFSHHVAWDHWSNALFFSELSVLYRAFSQAKALPFPDLPVQYKHYALWQREMFQGADLDTDLNYWKALLADAPAGLNLLTDHPRKPLSVRRGGWQVVFLSKELSRALEGLSKKASVTSFMTFLAAFQTLLHRITGEDDIVVGTPVAGRDRSETEGLIGLFLNSIPLRTNLSGNPTFLRFLSTVREAVLGAYDHQGLPFEKLVAELQPVRDLSATAIFQIFINMYNFKESTLDLDGLTVRRLNWIGDSAPQFDLQFYIREHDDGTYLSFVYDADLFESATIQRLLGQYQVLLEGIVANPEQKISSLPLMTDEEQRQMLEAWRGSDSMPAEERSIHQLFEAQVERTPNAIALTDPSQSLTYRDLDRLANQFARHLIKCGVGRGDMIPIFIERSCEMVIAVLGILKAGAAYVPLDIDYPKRRLAYMLADTRASVLVSRARCLDRLPDYEGDIICVDRDRNLFDRESVDPPNCGLSAAELAYVYYTSGSTGTPKGVLVAHRGVVRYCDFLASTYHLTGADIVLQVASFSFDASFRDLIAPLTAGATVVLVEQEEAKDPTQLISKIKQHRVTCLLSTVPPMLNALAETMLTLGRAAAESLRLILVSGEPLRGSLCRKVRNAFGDQALLVNQYGPTECTMTASYHWVTVADEQAATVPIGRPIPTAQLYVLDDGLNLTPMGMEGELYIGGDGLALGYLNRPELNAEAFVANPFSNEPGARLYKTGDIVRYRPDGSFVFVARRDGQVKIRSNRVELGEIESALGQSRAVRDTVVLAREDKFDDKQLVAYVVPSMEGAPLTQELREFLKQQLPEYMIPSTFVLLDGLPLTPNGKVDRKALPVPDTNQLEVDKPFVSPRNVIEETVAAVWREVLGRTQVGVHDNFFDLGGHSLKATQVVARLRNLLQCEIPLRLLFECSTVAELAAKIAARTEPPVEGADNLESLLTEIQSLSERDAQAHLTNRPEQSKGSN